MALDLKLEDFKKWVTEHPPGHVLPPPPRGHFWACNCPVATFLKSTRPDVEFLVSQKLIVVYDKDGDEKAVLSRSETIEAPAWVKHVIAGVDTTAPSKRTRELVLELANNAA